MAQHFLVSAKARTLSLAQVLRLSDEDAFATFRKVRWAANDGNPVCPRCGCVEAYAYTTRRIFKCKGCRAQFSVTSGTLFASRKLSYRDILAAIAIFVNGAKGVSALQLSRDLDVQYKTAFVLAHKLREAMAAEMEGQKLRGEIEVDGAYFGGYVKPENRKEDRKDRRRAENQNGKRRAVVVTRFDSDDISSDEKVRRLEQMLVKGTWRPTERTVQNLAIEIIEEIDPDRDAQHVELLSRVLPPFGVVSLTKRRGRRERS